MNQEMQKVIGEKPDFDSIIYVEFANAHEFYREFKWYDEPQDNRWLSRGIVHSTAQSAIASCKARLGIND